MKRESESTGADTLKLNSDQDLNHAIATKIRVKIGSFLMFFDFPRLPTSMDRSAMSLPRIKKLPKGIRFVLVATNKR